MYLHISIDGLTEAQQSDVAAHNAVVNELLQSLDAERTKRAAVAGETESMSFAQLRKKLDDCNATIHGLKKQGIVVATQRATLIQRLRDESKVRTEKTRDILEAARTKTTKSLRTAGLGSKSNPDHAYPDALERKLQAQVNQAAPVRAAMRERDRASQASRSCVEACQRSTEIVEQARSELFQLTSELLLKA